MARRRLAVFLLALAGACAVAAGSPSTRETLTTFALDADASVSSEHDATLASSRSQHRSHDDVDATSNSTSSVEFVVIIGVKTSVVHGFESRQAIRETWARPSATEPLGIRVVFLGCSPDLSKMEASERSFAQRAISLEKATYKDLLTDELRCEDSFETLVDKTVEFMYYVNQTASLYVMVADDDVFIRVDRLLALLHSDGLSRERLYAGNAAKEDQRRPTAATRDPKSKLYLPEEVYPMSELPPFVSGAHYIVSRDIVRFIARNRDDLRGLNGLDDVTMALWMLALQVHPLFIDGFDVLRNSSCSHDFISYADLSPTAIRRIQRNIDRGVSVCANYSYESWSKDSAFIRTPQTTRTQKEDAAAGLAFAGLEFDWNLRHDSATQSLHIDIGLNVKSERVMFVYVPAAGAYDASFCSRMLMLVRSKLSHSASSILCSRQRDALLRFLLDEPESSLGIRAKMAIALHNLRRSAADEAAGTKSPTLTIALSAGASYARVLLECLYSQMHPTHHIVVISEFELSPQFPPPDVFVFSVLDIMNQPPPAGADFIRRFADSELVMISGEAYTIHGLDPRVTLISTVESPRHIKHLDLPLASAMFGEAVRNHPLQLLQPATPSNEDRRFCAYLYHNCQRATREYMYDILNEAEPVDALGTCQGTKRERDLTKTASRMSDFYIDDAVDKYRNYKFTIAFENAVVPGYITEKIVTAFLAGAVPIYYGHSSTATRLFNPKAFIDCGSFKSLHACAERVLEVHRSPELYEAMRSEAPVTDMAVFLEAFSWHPAVLEFSARLLDAGEIVARPTPLSEKLHAVRRQ